MERMHGSIQKIMGLYAGMFIAQGRLMLSRVTESAQRMSGHLIELSATETSPVCHSQMHHTMQARYKANRLANGTLMVVSPGLYRSTSGFGANTNLLVRLPVLPLLFT